MGAEMVVFSLTNLETGKSDLVMKIPRAEFDERAVLEEALADALKALDRDPDRVIKICDRLLVSDPFCDVAAFDKGVALMAKGENGAAIQSFDLAIELDPNDPWNHLQKAVCLAEVQRDAECLECYQRVRNMDPHLTLECLQKASGLARRIRSAIKRIAKNNSNADLAQRILREDFCL